MDSPASDMPKMLYAEDGKWSRICVIPDELKRHRDAGPDKNWSCYRAEMRVLDEDGQELDGLDEICFWAMKSLHAFVKETYTAKAQTKLQRIGFRIDTRDDGKREVEWRDDQ